MRKLWRPLIVIWLALAVSAVLVAKRKAAAPAAVAKAPHAARSEALPQLVELGSETCVPCQKMAPILDELRKGYRGQLEVVFHDVYKHRDKAALYGIRVIPTQVFIGSDGKEFFRHEGFFPKEDILAAFRDHGVTLSKAKGSGSGVR